MVSFDFENTESISSSYVLTQSELGYSSSTLKPLIPAYQSLSSPDLSSVITTVYTKANGAISSTTVKGLLTGAFVAYDVTDDSAVAGTTAENPLVAGEYLFTSTAPMTATNVIRIDVTSALHDVDSNSIIV